MFINKEVADNRLNDDENLVSLVLDISSRRNRPDDTEPLVPEVVEEVVEGVVKPHHSGRPINGTAIPMEMKTLAGLLANFDTTRNVAKALGLNHATVNDARNGENSHGRPSPELKARLEGDLSKVRDKALDRLLSSLDFITDEKLEKCSAKDVAGISASMAKVVATTLPKDTESAIHAQLIVYAPTQINESKFEVVEL